MSGPWNLFRSHGDIELFHEVCLLVAEYVIDEDPYAVTSLLLLSKVNEMLPLLNGTLTLLDFLLLT